MALGWMFAAAAFTTVVHFVQLTVARHISSATSPGYSSIFAWKWPSAFYAIDIAAWDIFFGLALLFAVPAFAAWGDAIWVRRGLILSGSMCLVGLVGPFANVLGLRTIGIVGYTIVFGLTCLPLSRTFNAEVGGLTRPVAKRPIRRVCIVGASGKLGRYIEAVKSERGHPGPQLTTMAKSLNRRAARLSDRWSSFASSEPARVYTIWTPASVPWRWA
jgi:hypothetical protein